jgi:uncharacterized protein
MAVEWDEAKRLRNLSDHGVDFRDAALTFENPVIEAEDTRAGYGGIRRWALGQVDSDYFMVAGTWLGRNRRIISAWKMDEDGKRRYQAILSRKPWGAARPRQDGNPCRRADASD